MKKINCITLLSVFTVILFAATSLFAQETETERRQAEIDGDQAQVDAQKAMTDEQDAIGLDGDDAPQVAVDDERIDDLENQEEEDREAEEN